MATSSSQIFTSSNFRFRLTLVVAVPPPTGRTFFTSTGPQLCVSVSCVCSRRCTQVLMRAASSIYVRRLMKNVAKCERCCLRTPTKYKLFLVQLLSLSSPIEEKMALKFRIWRSHPHLHSAQTDQWKVSQPKTEKKLFIRSLRVLSLAPEFQVKDVMMMFIDFV